MMILLMVPFFFPLLRLLLHHRRADGPDAAAHAVYRRPDTRVCDAGRQAGVPETRPPSGPPQEQIQAALRFSALLAKAAVQAHATGSLPPLPNAVSTNTRRL